MRITKIAFIAVFAALVFSSVSADAQRRRRRRPPTDNNDNNQTTTPQTDDTQPNTQQQTSDLKAPNYNPYGNIPIEEADPPKVLDSVRKSLRNDGAVDQSFSKERIPLEYEHLRPDDALYIERVWREIDLREKINLPFNYKAENDNGDTRFVSILLNSVKNGKITAFDAKIDDRFTTPLSVEDLNLLLTGGDPDTIAVYGDLQNPDVITSYKVVYKELNLNDIKQILLKEDWVFDRESGKMHCRIIGIAPMKTAYRPDGTERGAAPMFWIYYPDLRPVLAVNNVYNAKNMGIGRMTWEELFEARMFSSYVTKSTLDNPHNKQIRNIIKNPILALLKGEEIETEIFNYEQNLWSY